MTATDSTLELIAHLHHISLDRYHAMIAAGILGEDDPVELLAGKIIDMSPSGRYHAVCVTQLAEWFLPRLKNQYICRQEQPITIPSGSEPEPDYVIAARRDHKYLTHHPYPEDIYLLIEVADQTLARDRGAKLRIYAAAGIPEYWILNLIDRQVEIYADPDTVAGSYAKRHILGEAEIIVAHPLAGRVAVVNLLP